MINFTVAAAAAVLLGLLYSRFIEPLLIEVSSHKVGNPSSPTRPLRILHLSDLHITGLGTFERIKLRIAHKKIAGLPQPVDLILVTGDFIENNHGIQAAVNFLKALPTPTLGIVACLGNHDYIDHNITFGLFGSRGSLLTSAWVGNLRRMLDQIIHNKPLRLDFEGNDVEKLISMLRAEGVHVLRNQNLTLQAGEITVTVLGIDDLHEGKPDVDTALKGILLDTYSIVLAHNPDLMLDPRLHVFDLAFCGHVHGGQICVPFLGPFYTHGSHLDQRKPSGWFQYGKTRTFVSRGFGEGTPLRFNCRPEIAFLEITAIES